VEFLDDTWMCGTVRHFYLDLNVFASTPAALPSEATVPDAALVTAAGRVPAGRSKAARASQTA
jgi:hypothetical protein